MLSRRILWCKASKGEQNITINMHDYVGLNCIDAPLNSDDSGQIRPRGGFKRSKQHAEVHRRGAPHVHHGYSPPITSPDPFFWSTMVFAFKQTVTKALEMHGTRTRIWRAENGQSGST